MPEKTGSIKTVLLVISNLEGGGAQRVASNLSVGLSGYYRIRLVLHDAGWIIYPYRGEIVDMKTPVAGSVAGKAFSFIKRVFRLSREKKAFKPAAVISFLESSNFINLLAGKRGKTILSVRNFKSKQGRSVTGKLFQVMIKLLYRKSDQVVVPARGIKDDLVNNFNLPEEKVKVIYNPYDLDDIAGKAKEKMNEEEQNLFDGPLVITAGSLIRQKGHWHLIRACAKVKEEIPGLKVVILGEGKLRSYLEELARNLGLQDDIMMPGFKSNPFKYMSRSSLFVLPSLFEGFPNVLVEAMACGVPVAAADCPAGPREILDPAGAHQAGGYDLEWAEYGVLLPVCSGDMKRDGSALSRPEQLMAEAILKMLEDDRLRKKYAEQSIKRAADFALNQVAGQWVELIDS